MDRGSQARSRSFNLGNSVKPREILLDAAVQRAHCDQSGGSYEINIDYSRFSGTARIEGKTEDRTDLDNGSSGKL
jgi:hypothetical protein